MSKQISTEIISLLTTLDLSGISKSFLEASQSISNIKDQIYFEKLSKFFTAPSEHKIEIKDFIKKTKEKNDWQKVGKEWLLIIDSFSTFDKCYYYGKIWISWLENKITINEFIETTNILQNILITDLQQIIKNHKNSDDLTIRCNIDRLYNCGFLERKNLYFSDLNLGRNSMFNDDRSGFKDYRRKIEDHLKHPYSVTELGIKLINILK